MSAIKNVTALLDQNDIENEPNDEENGIIPNTEHGDVTQYDLDPTRHCISYLENGFSLGQV